MKIMICETIQNGGILNAVNATEIRINRSSQSTLHSIIILVLSVVLASFMMMSFVPADASLVADKFGTSSIGMFVGRIIMSLPDKEMMLPSACVCYVIYIMLMSFNTKTKARSNKRRVDIPFVMLSLLFAFSMVFGQMIDSSDSALSDMLTGVSQWLKIVLGFVSYAVVGYVALSLIDMSTAKRTETKYDRKIDRLLDFTPLILIICWLPFLIATAPGIMMGDTSTQMKQFFGYENSVSSYSISSSVNLISPDMLITQHHPVIHTLFLGACMQIGHMLFGNYPAGYMMYTVLQFAICLGTLSFGMRYLKRRGVSPTIRLIILILMLIIPWFVGTSLLATKDGLFCCAAILFVLSIDNIANSDDVKPSSIILMAVSALLTSLLRNGVILAAIATVALVFIARIKRNNQQNKARTCVGIASALVGTTGIYFLVTSLIFPAFNISGGSPREMLSLPIQQVSAIVKYDGNDISADEKSTIDAVLDYDVLADNYEPEKADATKNTWNKDATNDDEKRFLSVLIELAMRHPLTAAEATMRNYYGYLYPSGKALGMYNVEWSDDVIENGKLDELFGFTTDRNVVQKVGTNAFDAWLNAFEHIPVLSIFSSSATYVWMMIVSLVFAFKRKSSMRCGYIFILFVFLIVLIGPCNGTIYYRYILPLMFTLPFMMPIAFSKKTSVKIVETDYSKHH